MKYDIVIIGSGVAGLTAAIYATRAKKSVLIIEENNLGGTTATLDSIENYPGFSKISGFELIQNMYSQVVNYDTNIEYLYIKQIDFDKNIINADNITIEYGALIIASGTSYKRLNIANEEKYRHKGISYCAVCDGSLFRNKNIVVVTKGMTGKDSVEYLYNITTNITVLDISNKYNSDNLKVYHNVSINNLIGDENLSCIEFSSDNKNYHLDIDGLFVALGKETDLRLYQCKIDNDGKYIMSDENMHTNFENVFVAGDVRKKSLRQIVTACSDGAIAATEAIKFLSKK